MYLPMNYRYKLRLTHLILNKLAGSCLLEVAGTVSVMTITEPRANRTVFRVYSSKLYREQILQSRNTVTVTL